MEIVIYMFLFLLWAVFWSFWSVLIRRLKWLINKDVINSILYWRSKCVKCNANLNVIQLIPFFWWFIQKWNCMKCWCKISCYYPWLEFVSWLIFVLTYIFVSNYLLFSWFTIYDTYFWLFYLYFVVINWLFVLLIFFDILFFHVNTYFWLFLTVWIIFWQFFWFFWDFMISFIWWIWFFLLFISLYYFWKIYVKYRFWLDDAEWIWFWDVMIAFSVWLLLPFFLKDFTWYDFFYIMFIYLILSSIIWILFYIISSIYFKWKQGSSIPFLPSMIIWFWVILFYSEKLLSIFY